MNHTKTIIAMLAATLMFTSCQHTYDCVCSIRPGATPRQNVPLYVAIKAKNRTMAADKCDTYDNEIKDCTLP